MTSSPSSVSRARQFMPISPKPPRGMMRSVCAVSRATTRCSLPDTLTAPAAASSRAASGRGAEFVRSRGGRVPHAVHPLPAKGSTAVEASWRQGTAKRADARATDGLRSENWTVVVPNVPLISAEEAQRLLGQGYTYVDVRSESEFVEGHAPGALNVPLQR